MDMEAVKEFGITCIKVAPWAALAAVCVKGAWDMGNRRDAAQDKPVEPFKNIKHHTLSDFLPK